MIATSKITQVSCGKGLIDRTPKFMNERQRIMDVINSVYEKHCAEKIETPVFEIKEVFSNKKYTNNKVIELDDQGGSILALRYDLKTPLVRFLASKKIESHKRYTQSGYIYRKEGINLKEKRLREFFVSDFDICGPADSMLTEAECLRVICDVLKDLNVSHSVTIKVGHRKLTECLLRLATGIPESQSIKLINKLADSGRNGGISWSNCSNNDLKSLDETSIEKFRSLLTQFSGAFDDCINLILNHSELSGLKEAKNMISDVEKLSSYCKAFLTEDFINRMEFDGGLIGSQSYFTGIVFHASIDNENTILSGGRYENLVGRFNSAYKEKMGVTGFSFGVDKLVLHQLEGKEEMNELMQGIADCGIGENNGDITGDNTTNPGRIRQKFNKNLDTSKTPKGSIDREADQMHARDMVFNTIINCFKRYNGDCIDTPVIERKDVLTGKYGEDSKLIYDLDDIDGEKLSLRYDLTVPFARYLAMHPNCISNDKLFKRYQIGRVYRRDNPSISTGRYREFYQCDFDIAGNTQDLMKSDCECLSIVYEILNTLDLGEFRVKVNHRSLLDGLFCVCGVPDHLFKAICSSVDKLDKTPWESVRYEMIEKGISADSADMIGRYVEMSGGVELIDELERDSLLMDNKHVVVALRELRVLFKQLADKMDRIQFDLSLARGLDYYTGMIFEAVVSETMTNADSNNAEERVGSVSGGGRYDNLVNMFSESETSIPCVGLSLGVERLMAIYQRKIQRQQNCNDADECIKRPDNQQIMVISASEKNFPLESPEGERMKILSMLLNAGFKCQHSMKRNPKTLNMFQECEDNNIPVQVVIGRSELDEKCVQLRNTVLRTSEKVPITELVSKLKEII